jgi:hypothetical protein
MSANLKSQSSAAPSASSTKQGGFYLPSRTKVWVLAVCLTLMVGASVYAVFQSLNPDPRNITFSTRFWYPIETNPNARLQAVRCTNDPDDYACRLNSVAVNGAENLPEIWALGNVGLVLHRKAGQSAWEQLIIAAKEESDSAPPPSATSNRKIPATTQSGSVLVPSLIGLTIEQAQKTAYSGGFQLQVEYESGTSNAMAQQGPPPDLRVLKQSPEPKTLVAPKSSIKVILGRAPKSAARLLLDKLVPSVYAAEPEKQPSKQPKPSPPIVQRKSAKPPASSGAAKPPSGVQPSQAFKLDDDLLYVSCSNGLCSALGRSGRIYKISSNNEWTFKQAHFIDSKSNLVTPLYLLYATNAGSVIAKSGTSIYTCSGGTILDTAKPLVCSDSHSNFVSNNNQVLNAADQLPSGRPAIFEKHRITSTAAEELLVGDSGFVAKLRDDQGTSLIPIEATPSGTDAALRSFAFASSNHGFIVGDHGIILSTTDGGENWRHQTQGPEGVAPNHRLPAGWYWVLAVLLIATCTVVVAAPPPPPATEFSVADWAVTDAPLKPGDLDSLNFTPMALGLSRFIRNPKTEPPVTIAIEGEWGEGKSSVMGLLRGDLEKSRFRPVWFNAWHHQSEDQLLAALLEHIKTQAVPPWWHIDNWIFRVHLLRIRFREKWALMITLTLAFSASFAYEISRHSVRQDDLAKFAQEFVQLVKYLLPWSSQKELPGDLGHFGLLATILAMLAAILNKAKTFGIDPAKLTDNLRQATTIKDIKPDPGIRRQFSSEFGDLCSAWSWGGRRVIIFIDDLDRCRPESVITVLESVNFLTSAGKCMIVMGMAQKQVTHCVGLGFKDIAESEEAYRGGCNTEQEKARARFNFGTFYIKKLVNIVAPLPKTTEEQRRRVLELKAAESRRQDQEQRASAAAKWRMTLWEGLSHASRMSLKVAPVFVSLLAVFLSLLAGYRQGALQKSITDQVPSSTTTEKRIENPSAPAVHDINSGAVKPLVYDRPTSLPATLANSDNVTGGVWWSYGVDLLFLLLLFSILAYQLSARTNQDAQNSPEFEKSLKLWGRYIVTVCDTPREIKRALNDLRYQAMTRRNNGPSITRGERIIKGIRQFVTGRPEHAPIATRVDEAALPPHKAGELANLTDDEWKYFLDPVKVDLKGSENLKLLIELKKLHLKEFGRWITEAKPAPKPENEIGLEDVVARAAHQA